MLTATIEAARVFAIAIEDAPFTAQCDGAGVLSAQSDAVRVFSCVVEEISPPEPYNVTVGGVQVTVGGDNVIVPR